MLQRYIIYLIINKGIFLKIYSVKVSILDKNHGPKATITEKTVIILGTALSVCSWTDETAWSKLIIKPTVKAVSNNGIDKFIRRATQ